LLPRKARRVVGSFFQREADDQRNQVRKKVRVESTFQIKHRFLLRWLKNQTAKEASEALIEADPERSRPMHPHEAA
jgi:hypothetical protein